MSGMMSESGINTALKATQSFVIEIKSQENHSWQGNITWVEGRKKESFRSMLEMLQLMDSVWDCKKEFTK